MRIRNFSPLPAALFCLIIFINSSLLAANSRLGVDLSDAPDEVMLSAFDLSIVRADARLNLETQKALGNQVLALINVFEVPAGQAHAQAADSVGVPLLETSHGGYQRLDATHPNWVPLVVHEIIQDAAERGFDGFVICGLKTLSQDAERAACIRLMAALEKAYPDKQLVLEGGLDLVADCRRELEGVLFLGPGDLSPARREMWIRQVRRQGIQPLVVDYASADTRAADIEERARQYRAMGALPTFATPDLQGSYLGPLKEIHREVAVLHNGDAHDSFTARTLHGSLEWLGYKLKYIDVAAAAAKGRLETLSPSTSAVIFDKTLDLAGLPQGQTKLLKLGAEAHARHLPLLLTRPLWNTPEEFVPWAELLGLGGSGEILDLPAGSVRQVEHAALAAGGILRPHLAGFVDMRAPAGARVLFSTRSGESVCDSAFTSTWGGMWLEETGSQGPLLAVLPFLEACLHGPRVPVPDLASQNGRRLFIPTLSSEGFTRITSLPGLPTAGEVMTERLLSRYSLPFTVALCEGEVNATAPGQERRNALRHQAAARRLLALPQVHAASATATRPQTWQAGGPMEQEVAGSLAALHRQLLPANKKIELILWPESSPVPDAATVAFSRQMGVENASAIQQPSTGSLPPVTWGKGRAHRTIATGAPRPGGKLNAQAQIHRAEMEDQSRWLQPLNLLLSFEDAVDEPSLEQAEQILDWCASRPLQAMSLADYAQLTRDAAETHFFQQAPGHWIVVNAGFARTFRLPASQGLPDLDRSIGLAGYTVRGEDLYIHTLGRRRTEIVLSQDGSPRHLRLAASSGAVRYLEAGHQRALLQVTDLRPVELDFAGIAPGATCQVLTTEQPQLLMADAQGRLSLTVPARSTVQLQVLPATESAMR